MQKEDLDFFRKWFSDYSKQFFSPDPLIQENIALKIGHTERVCKNTLILGKAEKMGEKELFLAETIAIFHDLGRFEQFVKYKTFLDSESENHALLALKILKKTGVLSCLSLEEKNIVLKAVEYHNLIKIPESAKKSRELLFYSKLIRDADKVDIMKLVSEDCQAKEKGRNPALENYLPDIAGCSQAIITDILNNRMAKIGDVKNQNDMKLLRLSWIFDINFTETFLLLKQRGYMNVILSSISGVEEVNIIENHLGKYLQKIEMNYASEITIDKQN
ncbi:MAG: HD domain-containing protein [Methanosarcina sp.]